MLEQDRYYNISPAVDGRRVVVQKGEVKEVLLPEVAKLSFMDKISSIQKLRLVRNAIYGFFALLGTGVALEGASNRAPADSLAGAAIVAAALAIAYKDNIDADVDVELVNAGLEDLSDLKNWPTLYPIV